MAEREADRAHSDRLVQQAITALVSDAGREISPEFRRRLRNHDASPGLFDSKDLAASAQTGLEAEISRSIELSADSTRAVSEALRRRGEGYAREQKCQLVADRHPNATIASESVKRAFYEGAMAAASLILAGQPAVNTNNRLQLTENLLGPPTSGANP